MYAIRSYYDFEKLVLIEPGTGFLIGHEKVGVKVGKGRCSMPCLCKNFQLGIIQMQDFGPMAIEVHLNPPWPRDGDHLALAEKGA